MLQGLLEDLIVIPLAKVYAFMGVHKSTTS
jgi:hypothetical protein